MPVVLDLINAPRPRHPEKAHRPDSAVPKKPDWIRVKAPVSPGYFQTQSIMRANGLHTVCEEAGCPNIGECWEKKHATFMIMGDKIGRSEEHTSELQSLRHLVCRLLLEKKKT